MGRKREWVYFVECAASGLIKIGYTRDLAGRVSKLDEQSVMGVRLLARICGQGRSREQLLHKQLVEHRVSGEWFHPAPAVLLAVADACRKDGAPNSWRPDHSGPHATTGANIKSDREGTSLLLLEYASRRLEGFVPTSRDCAKELRKIAARLHRIADHAEHPGRS